MKRLLALLAGGLGLGALLRRRRARPAASPLGPTPADELRSRLAAAETRVEQQRPPAAAADEAPAQPPVDERREDVRERARRAIDELS